MCCLNHFGIATQK